tara:strand:+ start:431 stop:631 length:201 start_codon:yes stop_codon:yes gene_type:complete
MSDDFFETDLTPELCVHAEIEETPDGGICNSCMGIIYKAEFPDVQEISNDLLPKVDDLDDDFEVNL